MSILPLLLLIAASDTPTIESCAQESRTRSKHFCLEKTGKAEAIPAMLEVALADAKANPKLDGPVSEFFDAAENAGRLAAKTSETDILSYAATTDVQRRAFGLRASGHMLSILRMGYARGREIDEPRLAELTPEVTKVCKRALRDQQDVIIEEGLRCLGETRDQAMVTDIVAVMIRHPDPGVKHRGYFALRSIGGLSRVSSELRPLIQILEEPIPEKWSTEHVSLRGDICSMLRGVMQEGETWAQAAAQIAVEQIGKKNSQQRGKCEKLVEKAGGEAPQPRAKTARNWFFDGDLEKCRADSFGKKRMMFCAISAPAGESKRSFSLTFRDPSRLDKRSGDHVLVHRVKLKTRPNEYVLYEEVVHWELSERHSLLFVPIVVGTPDRYSSGYSLMYLFDTKKQKAKKVWKSPTCPEGCTRQEVQLRSKVGEKSKTVHYIQTVRGSRHTTELLWNGRTLAPKR